MKDATAEGTARRVAQILKSQVPEVKVIETDEQDEVRA